MSPSEKITSVRVHTAPMALSWLTDSLIATPMSRYPEHRERRSSWFGEMTAAVVEIDTNDGHKGLGYIGGGRGTLAQEIVRSHFGSLIVGKSPFQVELIWDQLYSASTMYGRSGVALEVISGIDIALWDLMGEITGRPVYDLIGGATRDRIRAYVTGNLTDRHIAEGFRDVKLALSHGPSSGKEGLAANTRLIRDARIKAGPDADIMLDCYMGLDLPYAIDIAEIAREHGVLWMEEPFPPEQIDSYLRLRDAAPDLLLTAGEHEFSRWAFRPLLERRAVDIIQPDIYRAGGISELKKIAAYASVHGVPVIPHGIGAPTYHFVASTTNSPRAEFVDVFAQGNELLLEGEPVPRNGFIELSDAPGFGYRLNERVLRGEARVAPIW
jgi:L-alanine-DL-glutamate epimerase-like enolase superfamily enzyme